MILSNTVKCEDDSPEVAKGIKGVWKDYEQKNQTASTLERLFPVKHTYHLVTQSELDKFFEEGEIRQKQWREEKKRREEESGKKKIIFETGAEVWIPFYEKYAESQGYYSFSRVGFSPNKQFALLCVKNDSNLTGFTNTYLLKKVKGKWEILRESSSQWIS